LLKRCLSVALAIVALTGTSGCTTQNPVVDTFRHFLPHSEQQGELPVGFEYLAVEYKSRASVMALGSREVVGEQAWATTTERWYNAQGEMLVLKNGRIDQAVGMTQEWRRQESHPPSWQNLSRQTDREHWTRELDLMPGYRMGQIDHIVTGKIPTPTGSFAGVPSNAQWFADEISSTHRSGLPWVFTQRFAVVDNQVVYSEQCLSENVCLKLRPIGMVKP